MEVQKTSEVSQYKRQPKYQGDCVTLSGHNLQGSFSAVSKPISAKSTSDNYSMEWKALAEIYTMQSVVKLENLKIVIKIYM